MRYSKNRRAPGNTPIVWDTATQHLPPLKKQIEQLLQTENA
jgi:uncharacterized protein with HEPN domain